MSLPHRFRYVSRAALVLCAGASLLGLPTAHATFNLATIHTFDDAADGNVTYPALVQGADGKFYGVNSTGGRSDNGTVFSLNANGGAFATLNTFTGSNQGKTPEGGLVQARDGNFYGTTSTGGNDGFGTLYQVVPTTGKLTALASFTNGDPGGNPGGTLIEGLDGFLYGTAEYGGIDNDGTVFRAAITGGADTLATITGGLAGVYPQSDLIQAADGNFYGTTSQGGTASLGTFFQVTPGGALNVLYSFTGGADGSRPLRGVVQGTDGAFYGVCNQGGTYGNGAIYRVAVSGVTATVTGLYSFLPLLGDGSNALGNLLLASDGNLYGTSAGGGAYGDGTIFEVTETGGFNVLYSFANGADGGFPVAGLTQGSDGRLYGTTAGQNGSAGTVFVCQCGFGFARARAGFPVERQRRCDHQCQRRRHDPHQGRPFRRDDRRELRRGEQRGGGRHQLHGAFQDGAASGRPGRRADRRNHRDCQRPLGRHARDAGRRHRHRARGAADGGRAGQRADGRQSRRDGGQV